MTAEQLRAAPEAHPFRPFAPRMADGRAFRVPHRDYVSLSPGGRTVIVYQTDESFSILDILLATELTVEPAAVTPDSGGSA